MIVPPRIQARSRREPRRPPSGEPDLRSVVLGISAFLIVAAACLYLVTHLAP